MTLRLENVLHQIKRIRKTNSRSAKDCAAFLNISKGDYREFEAGDFPLSLPEIELLAEYLAVPVQAFFNDSPYEPHGFAYVDEPTRKRYGHLRQKMIKTVFLIEQSKQGKNLDLIHEQTQIPKELLESYFESDSPITLDHFLEICKVVEVSPEQFFELPKDESIEVIEDTQPVRWQPEFPEEMNQSEELEDNSYSILINAIKQMPIEEQAILAKSVLNQMKNR